MTSSAANRAIQSRKVLGGRYRHLNLLSAKRQRARVWQMTTHVVKSNYLDVFLIAIALGGRCFRARVVSCIFPSLNDGKIQKVGNENISSPTNGTMQTWLFKAVITSTRRDSFQLNRLVA
jgi:hypothetical protein